MVRGKPAGHPQCGQHHEQKQLADGLDSNGHQIEKHGKQNEALAYWPEQQIFDPQQCNGTYRNDQVTSDAEAPQFR